MVNLGRGLDRYRHRARRRTIDRLADGPLAEYYRTAERSDLVEAGGRTWTEHDYLVVDLETTGLDSRTDQILSAGWVAVIDGRIDAATARHHLVRPPQGVEVGASATVHRITDADAATGRSARSTVEELLAAATGRVLVCHFAMLELEFIGAVCEREWGAGFWPGRLVDTMTWHLERARRLNQPITADQVRLASLASDYGLPPTRPHHALSDAFATAMVLIAAARSQADPDGTEPQLQRLLDRRSWT